MHTKILIDSIMRQTTVLIAHLSTAAGLRAPLAHLADQVFLDLANRIEEQGVGRKVVADMFGLALRGYQKRVQRLMETRGGERITLWGAVLRYVGEHGPVARKRILERFALEEDGQVAAVLNDLVSSGQLLREGRGLETRYWLADRADLDRVAREDKHETVRGFVWVAVYRSPGSTIAEIAARTGFTADAVLSALDSLIAEGRVASDLGSPTRYRSETLTVPVGSRAGWEAAVFDHFQAMCTAIAIKTRAGAPSSNAADTVGGATMGFDIYPGHPYEEQVRTLLQRVRADVNVLWADVRAFNAAHPVPDEQKSRVVFYMGQYVQATDDGLGERRDSGLVTPIDED